MENPSNYASMSFHTSNDKDFRMIALVDCMIYSNKSSFL